MNKLILIFFLSSCSIFSSKKVNNSPHLVTGGGDEATMSSDEIAKNLKRSTTMGGGIYELSAIPLTSPYLERRWSELAQSRGLQAADAKKGRQYNISRFVKNKTCIEFYYSVTRFEDSKNLSQWKLSIEVEGEVIPLNWVEGWQADQSFVSEHRTPTHMDKKWHNQGIACSSNELPIWKGFELQIESAYVPWPFSSKASIDWIFEALTKEDEAAVEARKKKKYQKYRGW